tara:strand:+ start:2650 stop:5259 length:2610 start_codon:yes stop_codon:yes gene_type:complete
MKTSKDIRKQFIDFFISKEHDFVRSSSVVPVDDPTLLFANAGMNQFKPIFLNQEEPKKTRLVNSQKCIRVSGKHNDLEEVGVDDYHHTFFEMLGNWSFGDYYKEEAISWAWELLTEVWKIDKERLWVSVYKDDDETKELWIKKTDIDPERILKFGKKENFWEMGETGPCGPCTEIHYYFGDDVKKQNPDGVNTNDLYREIWNLVFIQYNRDSEGKLNELPQKHVDTGMGLERIVGVLNNKASNYETDLFQPIIKSIEDLSGVEYKLDTNGIPHRVIADHIRMLCFSIADGAIPSNEGRGYVVRRVLRRASRFSRMLGMKKEFLYKMIDSVIEIMGDSYLEIKEKKTHIKNVVKAEEESFAQTLDKGLEVFEAISVKLSNEKYEKFIISGKDAFKLYDTYGFPLDLTKLMAKEKNISVDEKGFLECMEKQRRQSRSTADFKIEDNNVDWVSLDEKLESVFTGYSEISTDSKIVKFRELSDNKFEIVLNKTPFYAESGGQVGDAGSIKNNNLTFKVIDTQKRDGDIAHIGVLEKGKIDLKQEVLASVNKERRVKIRSNHTATHLLHEALKQVLGEHVQQSGSLVNDEKLRFDLTHYEKITDNQIVKIENKVNCIIRENHELSTNVQDFEEARKNGAVALFGEKYDDKVRVVDIPNFSKELCGGTHVSRTGDIGVFKIISESSLSTGVRRIEAITGEAVLNRVHYIDSIIKESKTKLKATEDQIIEKTLSLIEKNKELEKKIKQGIVSTSLIDLDNLMSKASNINGIKVILHNLDDYNNDLKELGDQFRDKHKNNGILILSSKQDDKLNVMCAITDDLISSIDASNIAKEIGTKIDGGGGGKKHIATAGGKNIINTDDLFKEVCDYLNIYLK